MVVSIRRGCSMVAKSSSARACWDNSTKGSGCEE